MRTALMITSLVLLVLLVKLAPPASALQCSRQWVCIDVQQHGGQVDFVFTNLKPYAVSISLRITQSTMHADPAMHTAFTLPGHATRRALRLSPSDAQQEPHYRYHYDWVVGSLEAQHDDGYVYRLPYAAGRRYAVLQGFNGGYSHKGLSRYAVDFDMPVGSAVHAVRDGVVVDSESQQQTFDPGSDCTLRANYIVIRHADGTTGEYYHLQHNGVLVKPGDVVARGQRIGLSGHTGCSNYPHLHFAVYKPTREAETRSLPIRFITQQGIVNAPRHGDVYDVAIP